MKGMFVKHASLVLVLAAMRMATFVLLRTYVRKVQLNMDVLGVKILAVPMLVLEIIMCTAQGLILIAMGNRDGVIGKSMMIALPSGWDRPRHRSPEIGSK